MNNGKELCRRLKQVRSEIAKANQIPFEPHECTHEGDCMGTCPRCEQEIRYLTRELEHHRQMGKAVKIVGVAALTGTMALASCSRATEQAEEGYVFEGEDFSVSVEDSTSTEQSDCIALSEELENKTEEVTKEIYFEGEVDEGEFFDEKNLEEITVSAEE